MGSVNDSLPLEFMLCESIRQQGYTSIKHMKVPLKPMEVLDHRDPIRPGDTIIGVYRKNITRDGIGRYFPLGTLDFSQKPWTLEVERLDAFSDMKTLATELADRYNADINMSVKES